MRNMKESRTLTPKPQHQLHIALARSIKQNIRQTHHQIITSPLSSLGAYALLLSAQAQDPPKHCRLWALPVVHISCGQSFHVLHDGILGGSGGVGGRTGCVGASGLGSTNENVFMGVGCGGGGGGEVVDADGVETGIGVGGRGLPRPLWGTNPSGNLLLLEACSTVVEARPGSDGRPSPLGGTNPSGSLLLFETDSVSLDVSKSGCDDFVEVGGDDFDGEYKEPELVLKVVETDFPVVVVEIGGDEVD